MVKMTGKDELFCTDCYFSYMRSSDKDLDCCHPHAMPENGAPEGICSEPHNCPFYSEESLKWICEKCGHELKRIPHGEYTEFDCPHCDGFFLTNNPEYHVRKSVEQGLDNIWFSNSEEVLIERFNVIIKN